MLTVGLAQTPWLQPKAAGAPQQSAILPRRGGLGRSALVQAGTELRLAWDPQGRSFLWIPKRLPTGCVFSPTPLPTHTQLLPSDLGRVA